MLRHDKAIVHPIRQKDHLKNVPDYLMPASMRGLTTIRQKSNKKKRKLRNTTTSSNGSSNGSGASQEQRVLRSKLNNPLYNCPQVTTTHDDVSSVLEVGRNDVSNYDNDVNNRGDNTHDNDDHHQQQQSNLDKVYANSSILGESKLSGRREWKLKHKKGAFNPKILKRNTHRTPGSFIKSKNYK